MSAPRNASTKNDGRVYLWRGDEYPSVTTVISGGTPKPALKAWGEKLVAETAVKRLDQWKDMTEDEAVDWLKRAPTRTTDAAAVQGSDIHDWCERYVNGDPLFPMEAPEAHRPYLDAFLSFLSDWKPEYVMTEVTVYSREHGYAGTLDFIARIDGTLYLGDYKTGKGVYGEVALQLAAYRYAEFIGRDDEEVPVPEVDACVVLHLTPKGYSLVPVVAGREQLAAFLDVQKVRSFVNSSRKLLLTPLAPSSWEMGEAS